jgi:hypothetical protein
VAVGFTPGEVAADGRFEVRGANGHAWPEVYLDGYGWVPFEPTPGRGIPGATEYTGLPEEQAVVADPSAATTLPPTTAAVPLIPPQGVPTDVIDPGLGGFVPEGGAVDRPSPWPGRLATAALVLVGLPAVWVVVVGVAGHLRRWRRRAAAATPEARVTVAWAEVREALVAAGHAPLPSHTPAEVAVHAAEVPGVDPALLGQVADAATTAAYDPGGVDPARVDDVAAAATTLTRSVRRAEGRRARLRAALAPWPLLPTSLVLRRIGEGPVREAAAPHHIR